MAFGQDDESGSALPADDVLLHLYLSRHDGPTHAYDTVVILKDVPDGGFQVYFCSADCLQEWFDGLVARVRN
jgi:hypothetical protein